MPLEDIIFHHGLQYVMYADDMQLYITCSGDQVPTGTIKECVGEICNWMRANIVALNDRSTGVIHFSGKLYVQGPVPSCNLKLAQSLCLLIQRVILGSWWTRQRPCRIMSKNYANQHRSHYAK